MNRDTKFRGKLKDNGLWVEGSLLRFGERRFIIPPAWGDFDDKAPLSVALGRWIEVLPETVGEFTGLQDKNGKDGYFDDIIEDKGDRYVVEWDPDEGVAYLKSCLESSIDMIIAAITGRIIIGNKWENPDLLEGESQ